MKLKTIPLLLCLSALSLGANAKNEVTFSAGISSFAEIQNFSYSDGDEGEYTLGVLQFIGAANLNAQPMLRGRVTKLNNIDVDKLKVDKDVQWVLRRDRAFSWSNEKPKNNKKPAANKYCCMF